MGSQLTFLDTGVLIAAYEGDDNAHQNALALLRQTNRSFASSSFVRLELIPKPYFLKKHPKVKFYHFFLDKYIHDWATLSDALVEDAYSYAKKYGLGAMDALHIAAAISLGCVDFITTEKVTKPMHRVQELNVISINP